MSSISAERPSGRCPWLGTLGPAPREECPKIRTAIQEWLAVLAQCDQLQEDAVVDTTLDHAQTLKEFGEETQGKARVSRSAFLRKVSAKAAALAGPDEDEVDTSDGPGPGEDADTSV